MTRHPTKREIARAQRERFENDPYRVVYGMPAMRGIRTFTDRGMALEFATRVGGAAYAGTLAEMTAGTAERI